MAEILPLARPLQHATALLLADAAAPVLGLPLASPLLYEITNAMLARGRLDVARSAIMATDAWLTALPAGMRKEPGWQREQSVAANRLGDLAVATGDLKEAARCFAAALDITGKLAAADPGNTEWQRDLSVTHAKLAGLAEKQEDHSAARVHWQAAHDTLDSIDQRGLHLSPNDRRVLQWLKQKLAALPKE